MVRELRQPLLRLIDTDMIKTRRLHLQTAGLSFPDITAPDGLADSAAPGLAWPRIGLDLIFPALSSRSAQRFPYRLHLDRTRIRFCRCARDGMPQSTVAEMDRMTSDEYGRCGPHDSKDRAAILAHPRICFSSPEQPVASLKIRSPFKNGRRLGSMTGTT